MKREYHTHLAGPDLGQERSRLWSSRCYRKLPASANLSGLQLGHLFRWALSRPSLSLVHSWELEHVGRNKTNSYMQIMPTLHICSCKLINKKVPVVKISKEPVSWESSVASGKNVGLESGLVQVFSESLDIDPLTLGQRLSSLLL